MKNVFYWLPRILAILFFVMVVGIILYPKKNTQLTKKTIQNNKLLRYVALGDSYTIGLGVRDEENWPNQLVKKLNSQREKVVLVANLGVSGYTAEDAIKYEAPELKTLKPDLVTLLIGANDNFMGLDRETYKKDLQLLLDQIQNSLSNPKNLIIITIPDHTRTPSWRIYMDKEETSKSIVEYNNIIKAEAKKRDLLVVDIFPLSQSLTEKTYYIEDGLHPSYEGYKKWVEIIFEVTNKSSFFTP